MNGKLDNTTDVMLFDLADSNKSRSYNKSDFSDGLQRKELAGVNGLTA